MVILVIGGAASGKSELCEDLACEIGGKRLYAATMLPYGNEAAKRIERHIKMRADKGFESIDCYTDLSRIQNHAGFETVVIECMSNLVANEMFEKGGNVGRIPECIDVLAQRFKNVLTVSNDVFSDGECCSAETEAYIRNIGEINMSLAERADAVIEVVASIPVIHKGRDLVEKHIQRILHSVFNV